MTSTMGGRVRVLTAIAAAMTFSLVSIASAQAQGYAQPDPLDPYAQPQQSYTYAPAPQGGRAYPYVGVRQPAPSYYAYPRAPQATPKIVHRPPSEVVEREPMRVKRKQAVAKIEPAPKPERTTKHVEVTGSTIPAEKGRVIRAEAEVTIIGPDRMSIRLFRRREASPGAAATSQD